MGKCNISALTACNYKATTTLCRNQIETPSPPGHTWEMCSIVIFQRREFDPVTQAEGGEFVRRVGDLNFFTRLKTIWRQSQQSTP